MLTIIWLIFTTVVGYFIGDHFADKATHAAVLGALCGFIVGVIIRWAPSCMDDIGDVIGDIFD